MREEGGGSHALADSEREQQHCGDRRGAPQRARDNHVQQQRPRLSGCDADPQRVVDDDEEAGEAGEHPLLLQRLLGARVHPAEAEGGGGDDGGEADGAEVELLRDAVVHRPSPEDQRDGELHDEEEGERRVVALVQSVRDGGEQAACAHRAGERDECGHAGGEWHGWGGGGGG
eukprot:CAMPEP_0195577730 /NCGR_PEP_ID=MMETSP0814-20130614/10844_1 /TAXON_ID=97485 /ORGANISM="Prymnesium parvum, Strain Texoma1" /LENGTH=172 /DNA_ID=CAMNT_0040714153 /DNA_START=267 /DNA_END=782 /DNA_ORIENTATION=-